jgi:hypothetical protein
MYKVTVSLSDKGGWTCSAVSLHLYAYSLNDTRSLFLIDLTPICQEPYQYYIYTLSKMCLSSPSSVDSGTLGDSSTKLELRRLGCPRIHGLRA